MAVTVHMISTLLQAFLEVQHLLGIMVVAAAAAAAGVAVAVGLMMAIRQGLPVEQVVQGDQAS